MNPFRESGFTDTERGLWFRKMVALKDKYVLAEDVFFLATGTVESVLGFLVVSGLLSC